MLSGQRLLAALAIAAALLGLTLAATHRPTSDPPNAVLARGKYLVVIAGCNDCHTTGWRESDGKLPTSAWLTGSNVGYRGAWGTSYPPNLRLEFQVVSEDRWLTAVATRGGRPPMIWHDLRGFTQQDLHAVYTFIRSLGPAGSPSPRDVSPEVDPRTPYVDLRHQEPPT